MTTAEYAVSNVVFGRIKVGRFSQLNDPFELLAPKAAQRHFSEDIRRFRENFDADNGVVCFSSDWIDPVLWSHYGGRHTGICLGFDVPDAILRNVTYQSERIVLDKSVISAGINAALVDRILNTKFESWRYERERRMQIPLSEAEQEGNLYFTLFDEELELHEVILGPLCTMHVDAVRNLVKKLHADVVTFQARLAENTFHIVPAEGSVPRLRAPTAEK